VVELRLAKIWEELLNVSPVGVLDDFFELGGHSMLAASMMARIQQWLGVSLPFTVLFQEATIEYLAGILRRRVEPAKAFSSLVEIQPGAGGQPFFCVHPSGGNVLCYVDLARHLGPGQGFYGFQSKGLDEQAAAHTSIEEMAAHYIELMRGVQPDGPYFLGGWSMGGLVAFEMAQQLDAQQQEVALLALFDTHLPDLEKYAELDDLSYIVSFAQDLGLALDGIAFAPEELHDVGEGLSVVLERAKSVNMLPPYLEVSELERLFRIFKMNVQAMLRYVPRAYSGRITLFRAADGVSHTPQDSTSGWERFAAGGLEIHNTPGTHYGIVRPPHVKVLAKQLSGRLRVRPASDDGRPEISRSNS
jgi:thioesterase domain-containing protein/acyl carrier protein